MVRLVLDNLNTHRAASLYETAIFGEARRIAKRLEFHYTPKFGSSVTAENPSPQAGLPDGAREGF